MGQILPCSAGDLGSVPGWETKIPCGMAKKLKEKETHVCNLGKFQFIDFSSPTSSFFCSLQEIFAYLLQGHAHLFCLFSKLYTLSSLFRAVILRDFFCVYVSGRDQSLSNRSSTILLKNLTFPTEPP